MNKLLNITIIALVFGCDSNENLTKIQSNDSMFKITKTDNQRWIVIPGIHRNHDTVYVVDLPNPSASEIENDDNGYEGMCLCPSDFRILKTDRTYSTNFVADVFISEYGGFIQAKGKTYGYKYHYFLKALSASRKGVRIPDSSVGPNSMTTWLKLKLSNNRFVGYSMDGECDIFDYRFRDKYLYFDGRTTKSVMNEYTSTSSEFPDECKGGPGIPLRFFVCSERHFWTDSVDICVRARSQFKDWLSNKHKKFDQIDYKRYYTAYYITDLKFDKLPNAENPQKLPNNPVPL